MSQQATPHHVHARHYAEMLNRPTTEVVLEAARGAVGGKRLAVGAKLWGRIKAVALPQHDLGEDRTTVGVGEGAKFVTALKENEAKTDGWPEADKRIYREVLALLYQHAGLVISTR